MSNKSQLLLLKGCQNKNIEKQVITPSVIRITDNDVYSNFGDLMKIKGFITNFEKIDKLKELDLTITFGTDTYTIPFSDIMKNNTDIIKINNYGVENSNEDNDNAFIEFPHDLLLTHKIPLICFTFSKFTVSIKELDDDMTVYMVCDTYILDVEKREEIVRTNAVYNVKNIQEFKLKWESNTWTYRQHHCFNTFESVIDANFLTQGIIIKSPKNKVLQLKITLNDTIKCLEYDNNLINIYGEDIGDNLSYFGFNVEAKFNSNNQVGCINMSVIDKVNVKVRLLTFDLEPISIYTVSWNEIQYKDGLHLHNIN